MLEAGAHDRVTGLMRTLAVQALERAPDVELLFVTNLQNGAVTDVGPHGIVNTSQYYTRRQADEIIRSFQDLGLTVTSFFSELDFLAAATSLNGQRSGRHQIVFTTAEGGTRSGRRALIPALCNLLALPVLNSGAHACSLARHKFHANAVLRRVGVRTPETWQFDDGSWAGALQPPKGARVIVKPAWESMCIGVSDDSVQVVDAAFEGFVEATNRRFAQPVVVQEFISGEEVGVPIARIGSTYALPPVAFRKADGEPFGAGPKTFRDEVLQHNVSLSPFDGSDALSEMAVRAFDALDMSGVGRIDFRVDADGRAWAFDTNESPPPLAETSYALAMEQLGFDLRGMLSVWLGVCLLEYGLISRI